MSYGARGPAPARGFLPARGTWWSLLCRTGELLRRGDGHLYGWSSCARRFILAL